MGLSRLFFKDTLVDVYTRYERFYVGLEYDGMPTSLADTLERWPELELLRRFFSKTLKSESEIPLQQLHDFLQLISNLQSSCAKFKKIRFEIPPNVRRVCVRNEPPADFTCSWRWRNGSLLLDYGSDIMELQDGWYRRNDEYWRYPMLSESEIEGMRRKRIEKNELLDFITNDLPIYEKAGVTCACELSYSPIPTLSLDFEAVERERVRIEQSWSVPPESVDSDFDLFGYVVADQTLRPGMRPADLRSHIVFEIDEATLTGLEIARFLDKHYASVRPWFSNPEAFENAHPWISPPYTWILAAHAESTRGIGKASASPVARIGGEEFTIDELTKLMHDPYAHLTAGWVRRIDLLTLGISTEGKWMDKGRFKRVSLSPAQVVCRGDARINGPWTQLELRGTPWVATSQKQLVAREHLRFLTDWGLPGGLTGGFEATVVYGSRMVAELFARESAARVLIAGSKPDLQEYMSSVSAHQILPIAHYNDGSVNIAYGVAHEALSRSAAAQGVSWDLLILIEPDVLYLDENRAAFRAVRELNAACRIGFYVSKPDSMIANNRSLQKLVLKLNAKDDVFACLVQDPRQPVPQPAPYTFLNEPAVAQDEGFEVVLQGEKSSGTPIPPRPLQQDIVRVEISALPTPAKVQMTQSASSELFLQEARKMSTVGGAGDAEHVPFACYWPKYSDMNALQKKWYYHLRGKIRRGDYPDTDLSYLFVHIYELLNGIGCESPAAAYDELMAIWAHYRDRHPKLDKYLSDWTFDFLMLRKPGASILSFAEAAPAPPKEAVNCALTAFDANALFILPLSVLEILSGYRIRQSKFYLSGYREAIDRTLPRAVALVDSRMREADGKGILDMVHRKPVTSKRFAFASAIIERTESYQITCIPFSEIPECSDLMSQILRYTENALRTRLGFSSKLRGVSLDSRYALWIDTYLDRQFEKKAIEAPKAATRVALDEAAIDKLRGESDEVRDALIASMENAAPSEEINQSNLNDLLIPERPADAPEGLLTDLAPVSRILQMLSPEQVSMLAFLRDTGWEIEAGKFAQNFAGILVEAELDTINAQAVLCLGTQIIERENDCFVVADDYRDELEYLMDHPQKKKESAWMILAEGLAADWLSFFSEADLDALGAVLEGSGAIEELALTRGEMPDLIIDALNAASMDAIGDLIIDGNSIAEDYVDVITEHMRKAG